MSVNTTVDVSSLPVPKLIADLSYKEILADMLRDIPGELLPSDPGYKILERCAYETMLTRAMVNDAVRGLLLPYATGADLDNLLYPVVRLVLDPGDPDANPPVPPTRFPTSSEVGPIEAPHRNKPPQLYVRSVSERNCRERNSEPVEDPE